MLTLEMKAAESRTTNLWVDNLIKPVFIMMLLQDLNERLIGHYISGLLQQ